MPTKLSIIIPVYNTSLTLRRCMESVISQSLDEWEIILIDDGSTDNAGEICDDYSERYPFVLTVHRHNQGLSAARNEGLEMATGDYVTFIDSDDWLEPDSFRRLVTTLESHPECDILEYSLVKEKNGRNVGLVALPDAHYDDIRQYWFATNGYDHAYACNKFFRRGLLTPADGPKIRFPEGKVFEDAAFMAMLVPLNPHIITSSVVGYRYYWNADGITATATGEQLQQLLIAQLDAAKALGVSFGQRYVPEEEVGFYLSILNRQISVCRKTNNSPIMPRRRVSLLHVSSVRMLLKVVVLDVFGMNVLCKL